MNDNMQPNDDESPPAAQEGAQNHGPELVATPPVTGDVHLPGMVKGPTAPIHLLSPDELHRFVQKNCKEALARHLKKLTKEQIGDCCIKYPTFALLFCGRFISRDQLEYCINEDPLTAIAYATELALARKQLDVFPTNHLCSSLGVFKPWRTDLVLLDICIRKQPGVTLLKAFHKRLALTEEQFGYCCLKSPARALKYAPYKMHDALFMKCARRNPWAAYKYAPDRLSIEELLRYACDHGYVIRDLLAANPGNPIVTKLAPYLGRLDEDTAKVVARAIAADV